MKFCNIHGNYFTDDSECDECVDKNCWECGVELIKFHSHSIGGRKFCGGCAASIKQDARQEAAEQRRIDDECKEE